MIRASSIARLPGIAHAFFTREGGVSEGIYTSLNGGAGSSDDPARVSENRKRMCATLGTDALITCYQVHSAEAVLATAPWPRGEAPRADAIVTKTPGLAIGVAVADCAPVLLADAEARVVGVAHAGWKGALGGIIEAAVALMEQEGAARERISAAIGPLIRQESYEVGAELVAHFCAADESYARFFAPGARANHTQFDLAGFLRERLVAAGVHLTEDLGLDTYADEARFFSYRRSVHRREPDYGRLVGAIALT
jgi:purine-nucleoside/S-methyl-5'-thioadenosine phosphorylase / adenosine deaminase